VFGLFHSRRIYEETDWKVHGHVSPLSLSAAKQDEMKHDDMSKDEMKKN